MRRSRNRLDKGGRRWRRALLILACAAGLSGLSYSAPGAPAADEESPDEGEEVGLPPIDIEPDGQDLSTQATVRVGGFRFEGNTVFSDEQLQEVVAPFVGEELTSEDLEEARRAVTQLYVDRGYINSGAILPDQTVGDDAVILLEVVEGRLTDIKLENQTTGARLRGDYLRSRIRRGARGPLNIIDLKNELELVRQNRNVRRINAELRPGAAPGESYLDVQVQEANPWQLGAQFSNRRSPSVGAEQLELLASHSNVTGNGDLLALRYGVNKGGIEDWEFAELDDFTVEYSLPVTPADTTVSLNYTRTDALVVEDPFQDLDITSETESVALTVRHPFYRKPDAEFAMFLSAGYRDNKTFLLGEPFSFSPGAEDGESAVFAVRLGQVYTRNSQVDAFALLSTFSLGVDALGATNNSGDTPDSQFFAWLGQAQYVRRLANTDTRLVLRGSAQLTPDSLLSIEQFAVGGVDTVRGYRENQIVRDNGMAGSVELHVPLIRGTGGSSVLELIPFFDAGYGYNSDTPRNSDFLSSVGVGLQFTPNRHLNAQVYYGYALRDLNEGDDDLQDIGLHFNVLLLAF